MNDPVDIQGEPSSGPVSVRDWIRCVRERLEAADLHYGHGTDNARDEAAALVLQASGLPPDPPDHALDAALDRAHVTRVQERLRRRVDERVPLAYLSGEAWFAGLQFKVDQHTLIPRSPMAELVQERFAPWVKREKVRRILDLCTGCGCIGIATALAFPGASVDMTDVSVAALDVARQNARRHGVDGRVRVIESDLYAALAGRRYDLIVSNPPYVGRSELDALPAEYRHEPELGLLAGDDGLDVVLPMLAGAAEHLADDGVLVVEVGNSEHAVSERLPGVPFVWLEFRRGGHGVFVLQRQELIEHAGAIAEANVTGREQYGGE